MEAKVVESNGIDIYRANREKVIQSIMRSCSLDRDSAEKMLNSSDIDHPIALDNGEACWSENNE